MLSYFRCLKPNSDVSRALLEIVGTCKGKVEKQGYSGSLFVIDFVLMLLPNIKFYEFETLSSGCIPDVLHYVNGLGDVLEKQTGHVSRRH